MLIAIIAVVAIIIAILLVVIAARPAGFRIVRSTTIAAPPATVYGFVNDFHQWDAWSPWARLDPEMKLTIGGPPAGVGAIQSWSGNKKVGEGRSTIIESRPPELVRIKLEFFKPFAATNTAEFTFAPNDGHTQVTWSMTGTNNFMGKAFALFANMDKMVGRDFEKGLAALKTAAEAGSPSPTNADVRNPST